MNVNATHSAAPTTAAARVQNLSAARAAYKADAPATTSNPAKTDRAELSNTPEMQRLMQLAKNGDVRTDKVADLKAQIAAGTYDLDAKADAVADRLLDDLGL